MEIFVADPCGFCYGVKRAVKIAEGAAENLPAATLGPLIHNPQFTAELVAKGVSCKDSLGDFLPGETVIFRSHGVGPEVYQAAIEKNLKILDATCPNVRISQKKAAQAATAEVKARIFLLSTMNILEVVCNKLFLILVLLI